MKELIFYVPTLQRLAAPAGTPPETAFFPAIRPPAQAAAVLLPLDASQAAAALLPLDASQAAAALNDMLRQGEDHAASGSLKQLAALEAEDDAWSLRAEMTDLERFAGSGKSGADAALSGRDQTAAPQAALAEKTRRALVDCQKVLLLANYLEERALEVAALQNKARDAEKALLSALGEGETAPQDKAWSKDASRPDARPFAPSWRAVVDAALPFLPAKAALLTLDEDMTGDLLAAGLLRPLPEDQGPLPFAWPQQAARTPLYASLPAWQLVGRRAASPERPWLERVLEIYALAPATDEPGGPTPEQGPGLTPEKDE